MSEIDPDLSRLYREAAREAPPPAVDAAILAAARRAATKPSRRAQPWWSRLMAPASLVATLVLGISITWFVASEHPETVDEGAAVQNAAPPPAAAKSKAERADSQPEGAGKTAPSSEPVAAPISAPSATLQPRPATVPGAANQALEGRQIKRAAPAAAKALEPSAEAGGQGRLREENVTADAAVAPAAVGAAAAPAPPAADKLAPKRGGAPARSPQAWLDDIRHLLREGREAEALAQLAEFRKAYPGVAIPPDLAR